MPGTYTIRTNPSEPSVQHAWCEVHIECEEQIECTLNDIVTKGVITPFYQPTKWLSLLSYPHKPDSSLHICLNPKDLYKAIVQGHHKAPIMGEIT